MQCLLEDAQDFLFAHDQELFAVELDLSARVLAKEDLVAVAWGAPDTRSP